MDVNSPLSEIKIPIIIPTEFLNIPHRPLPTQVWGDSTDAKLARGIDGLQVFPTELGKRKFAYSGPWKRGENGKPVREDNFQQTSTLSLGRLLV